MTATVKIIESPGDPDPFAFDVVCLVCQHSLRLHPSEPFVSQVHLFLDQHRHASGHGAEQPDQ